MADRPIRRDVASIDERAGSLEQRLSLLVNPLAGSLLYIQPGGQIGMLPIGAVAGLLTVTSLGLPGWSGILPAWTGLVYSNTWVDFGGSDATGAWFIDSIGVVHLRGLLKRTGAPAGNETIATLPVGARPAAEETFLASISGGNSTVYVSTDGIIHWSATGSVGTPQTFLSLSGITFRTT